MPVLWGRKLPGCDVVYVVSSPGVSLLPRGHGHWQTLALEQSCAFLYVSWQSSSAEGKAKEKRVLKGGRWVEVLWEALSSVE